MDSLPDEECALFCRATQCSFLRLLTTEAILKDAVLTNRQAIESWERLQRDVRVGYISIEPDGLLKHWPCLADKESPSPKLWMDAYLAALAIAGSMKLVTFDRGFRSFEVDGLDLLLLA